MSERCSPTEALELLMRAGLSASDAAERLTDAIHNKDNPCRLHCDGVEVERHIAKTIKVVASENDGRWTARVGSAVREAWERPTDEEVTGKEFTGIEVYGDLVFQEVVKPPYRWEFEIDQVKALVATPPTKLDTKAPAAAESVTTVQRKRLRTHEKIKEFAAQEWPDGYEHVEDRDLVKVVGDALGAKRDTILRALGRRR
jgi:hypothetical protein